MPFMTSNIEYNRVLLNIVNDIDIVYDHQTIINYIKNNESSPHIIDHINLIGISCFLKLENDKMDIDSIIYTFDIFDNNIVNKPIRYKKDIVMQYGYKILVLIK